MQPARDHIHFAVRPVSAPVRRPSLARHPHAAEQAPRTWPATPPRDSRITPRRSRSYTSWSREIIELRNLQSPLPQRAALPSRASLTQHTTRRADDHIVPRIEPAIPTPASRLRATLAVGAARSAAPTTGVGAWYLPCALRHAALHQTLHVRPCHHQSLAARGPYCPQ